MLFLGFYYNQQPKGFYYNQQPGFYYEQQQPQGFYYEKEQPQGFYYNQKPQGFYYEQEVKFQKTCKKRLIFWFNFLKIIWNEKFNKN